MSAELFAVFGPFALRAGLALLAFVLVSVVDTHPVLSALRRQHSGGDVEVQLTRRVRLGRIRMTAVAKRMTPAWRYFGCLNMAVCLLLLPAIPGGNPPGRRQ